MLIAYASIIMQILSLYFTFQDGFANFACERGSFDELEVCFPVKKYTNRWAKHLFNIPCYFSFENKASVFTDKGEYFIKFQTHNLCHLHHHIQHTALHSHAGLIDSHRPLRRSHISPRKHWFVTRILIQSGNFAIFRSMR